MLTLYTFGPAFGLSDSSPFVVKADLLLKMSGLPYGTQKMDFKQAPKGKAPYISDDGVILGDSYLIRRHLENKYNIDFTAGHDAATVAVGWAVERMLEEHAYFLMVYTRWLVDENFNKGPRQFFNDVPAPLRPFIISMVRRKVRKTLTLQGLGRHSAAERLEMAKGDVACVADILGDKPYLLGERMAGCDATAYAFLQSASTPYFNSELGQYIRSLPAISAYLKRIQQCYYG